jgi:phospholipase/lecithinase/hemolysin
MKKATMFLFASILAFSGLAAGATAAPGDDSPYTELIVFGDSLSDTGNYNLASGGVLYPPPYYEGRASNGPSWVERLAQKLDLPAPGPSLLGGTNYAFGGAETGYGNSIFNGTPNLGVQIDTFLGDGNPLCGDELIVVRAGGNDCFVETLFPGAFGRTPFVAASNIAAHVETLAAAGGETFLVPNLGGVGQTPLFRGSPLEGPADAWGSEFSWWLDIHLDDLELELEAQGRNVTILRFDALGLLDEILEEPHKFGLKNVTDAASPDCDTGVPLVPDPEVAPNVHKYLFWDLVHPTATANRIFGDRAARLVKRSWDDDNDDDD